MKNFDVLDRDLDIFGKHFLEASAGTGKTFALENLVCRLLLHPERSIPIEKILIVTFTKASTREIKARIRSTLENVKHYLTYDPTALDYVASLQERGEVQEALRKAEDALANFTQAQIYTIHGFCYRMLQEFAFTADIGLHITDVEDFGYKAIAKERVKDFLRLGLSNSYSPVQVEKILRKEGYDVDTFSEKLVKLIEKGVQIPSNMSFSEAIAQVQGKLQEISNMYSVKAEDFLQDFTRLGVCYKKMTSLAFEKQALFLGKLLQEKMFAEKDISLLLQQEELFLEAMEEGNRKLRGSFPEKNTLYYPDIFAKLREEIFPIFEKMNDVAHTMLRMGRDFQELWQKKQNDVELFSPDDIVKKMAKSVENAEFVSEIQKKYDACVIDEFQDTDTLQWKIFRTLFLDPKNPIRSLCFVGDPKQSIYSFRKADLYTYLQAKEEVGESSVLSTNYRSQPSLVKALNTLFSSETVKSWIRLPSLNSEMEYTHVKASPSAEEEVFEDGKGSLHFFIAESSPGREKKWPTSEMEEKYFFPFIAKEILYWKKRVPAKEIAILVRDRFQGKRLFTYLKQRNIAAFIKRSDSLTESPVFAAMQELFEAILEYGDVRFLKRVLGNILIGFSEGELQGGLENPLLEKASIFFYNLFLTFQTNGPGPTLHHFLKSIWRDDISVLENVLRTHDLSLYQDYMQLMRLITEYALERRPNLQQIIDFLEELKEVDPEQDERVKRILEEDSESITIMTIHVSKGLEFEVVFPLGLIGRVGKGEEFITVKENGVERLEELKIAKESSRKALEELDAEKMRQLYVALTRAKKRVYIPCALDTEKKEVAFGKASPIELFIARWGEEVILENALYDRISHIDRPFLEKHLEKMKKSSDITYCFLEEADVELQTSSLSPVDLVEPKAYFFRSSLKMIASYSSFAKKDLLANGPSDFQEKGLKQPSEERCLAEKTMYTLPSGVHTGILFHSILEDVFRFRLQRPLKLQKIEALVTKKLKCTALENWKDAIVSCVIEILQKPLETKTGSFCLCDIDPEKIQVEMEFMYAQDSTYLKGTIDMVFEKDGRYYFVDWKSNYLGSSRNEYDGINIEKAMREHQYFLQASIYQDALGRFLSTFTKESFSKLFGGCFYIFLRGPSSYHFIPDSWNASKHISTKDLIWNE